MSVWKVVGLEDAKVGVVTAAAPGVITYTDVPYANRADLATAVTNLTFEGDGATETVYVSSDVTGTFGMDKFSDVLLEALYNKRVLKPGQVASFTISNAGSGYTSAPTVVFTGGGFTTVATATAVISGGVLTAITITFPGVGYTSAPAITFTGGAGTGAAATAVLSTLPSNATGRIYFGQNTDFAPPYIEIRVKAAALNETLNRAEKVEIVIPRATPSPFKPGGLASRAKQAHEIEFAAVKTAVDLLGVALTGVPADGCSHFMEFSTP